MSVYTLRLACTSRLARLGRSVRVAARGGGLSQHSPAPPPVAPRVCTRMGAVHVREIFNYQKPIGSVSAPNANALRPRTVCAAANHASTRDEDTSTLYYDDPHLYDVAVNFRDFEQVR